MARLVNNSLKDLKVIFSMVYQMEKGFRYFQMEKDMKVILKKGYKMEKGFRPGQMVLDMKVIL